MESGMATLSLSLYLLGLSREHHIFEHSIHEKDDTSYLPLSHDWNPH
ncbi:unnamed protein product [Brassica rapa subsp. trilocularis]